MSIYIYGAIAVVLMVAGGFADHQLICRPQYLKLQADYATYKVQQSGVEADAQAQYSQALALQLKSQQDTLAHNAQVIQELQNENTSTGADLDFARRLLDAARTQAAAANPPAASSASGGPATAGLSVTSADRPLTRLIAGAAGECRDAMQRLAALEDEVIPQLPKVQP